MDDQTNLMKKSVINLPPAQVQSRRCLKATGSNFVGSDALLTDVF